MAAMKAEIGACTLSRKRGLLASNQSRIVGAQLAKKAKKSAARPAKGSVMRTVSFST